MITRRRFFGLTGAAVAAAVLAPLPAEAKLNSAQECTAALAEPAQTITINKHKYVAFKVEPDTGYAYSDTRHSGRQVIRDDVPLGKYRCNSEGCYTAQEFLIYRLSHAVVHVSGDELTDGYVPDGARYQWMEFAAGQDAEALAQQWLDKIHGRSA